MNAVILAAGRGSRLRTLGEGSPKCLLKVNGKTALNRLIDTIHGSGVADHIVVVGGYCIDKIRTTVPSYVTVLENERFAETNSIVSLDIALEFLPLDDLVFFNSDIVYEENLLLRYLLHPQKTAVLIDELSPDMPDEFYVRMHDASVVELSRGGPLNRMHGRDAQVYRVGKDLVSGLPTVIREIVRERGEDVYAGQVMPALLSRTHVQPVFTNGEFWGEFDTPEEYEEVDRLVTAAEHSGRRVEAYGLVRASRSQMHSATTPGRGVTAFLAALRRARNVVRERRLPSKLARPRDVIRALRYHPMTAIRFAWPLLKRQMSRKAYLLQVHGAEILGVFMREAEVLGIRPFLAWGTLLGCVRDNTFIFNDEDVDVGLLKKDFSRVEELKARMLARGYTVRRQDRDKISFFHPTATGLHIDVDRFFKDDACYWIQSGHSEDEFIYSNFFPLDTFDNLVKTHFAGVDVYVPANPDLFLRSVYGTWQIPEDKHDIRRGTLNLYMRRR